MRAEQIGAVESDCIAVLYTFTMSCAGRAHTQKIAFASKGQMQNNCPSNLHTARELVLPHRLLRASERPLRPRVRL